MHSPRAIFDDGILPDQALLLAGLAFEKLQESEIMVPRSIDRTSLSCASIHNPSD